MSGDLPALSTGRPRTVGLDRNAKSLIRNVMRHTDTHNRLLEESEMWQIYYRMKDVNPDDNDNSEKKRTTKREGSKDEQGGSSEGKGMGVREPDIKNSFLYDDRKDMRWEGHSRRGVKRAHMDDSSEEDQRNSAGSSKSTFWMRQLHKAEETDADRWGHTGFKELYPDAFDSDRSVTSEGRSRHKLKKKKHSKKRHKHKSSTKKKKQKKSDSVTVKKRKKKRNSYRGESDKEKRKKIKRERSNDESDNHSSTDSSRIGRKSVKMRSSIERSESDKDSENESEGKREWRNIKTENEQEEKRREKKVNKSHDSKKRRKH